MRGIIVRADYGRGLARQTYSFWKNVDWDVTVLVDMSGIQQAGGKPYEWDQNLDLYPDAIQTKWKGYTANFENPEAYEALMDCDVMYTAETFYDPRLEQHPNAVLHVNPEFYRGEPGRYWYPTSWRTETLPPGEIVGTPIDDDDIARTVAGPGMPLHVGGHNARMDRNGSRIVHGMLGRSQHRWKIASQDGFKMRPEILRKCQIVGNTENHWALYEDASMLVYPRRYGGQSLQVNEAMAKGLAVLMTDCPPNIETWPIVPVASRPASRLKAPGGQFQMFQALAPALHDTIDALMADPEMLERWQARSLMWARDNAWSQQRQRIVGLLGD